MSVWRGEGGVVITTIGLCDGEDVLMHRLQAIFSRTSFMTPQWK